MDDVIGIVVQLLVSTSQARQNLENCLPLVQHQYFYMDTTSLSVVPEDLVVNTRQVRTESFSTNLDIQLTK